MKRTAYKHQIGRYRGLGFGDQFVQQGDSPGQIALVDKGASESPATLPRAESVADGVRKVAPLFRRQPCCDRVTGDESRLSLLP